VHSIETVPREEEPIITAEVSKLFVPLNMTVMFDSMICLVRAWVCLHRELNLDLPRGRSIMGARAELIRHVIKLKKHRYTDVLASCRHYFFYLLWRKSTAGLCAVSTKLSVVADRQILAVTFVVFLVG